MRDGLSGDTLASSQHNLAHKQFSPIHSVVESEKLLIGSAGSQSHGLNTEINTSLVL